MITERIASAYPLDSKSFVIADLAASEAGAELFRVSTSSTAKIDSKHAVAFRGGSIVGIAVELSANKTAGTLTFKAAINGTATSFTVSVDDATDVAYASQNFGVTTFDAGDKLGVIYASDASLLPDGSADAVVDLLVMYDRVEF